MISENAYCPDRQVLSLVIGQAMSSTMVGLAIGLGALALTRVLVKTCDVLWYDLRQQV